MGTLRSLGALARALGPMVAASGEAVGQHRRAPGGARPRGAGGLPPRELGPATRGRGGGPPSLRGSLPAVYWLMGAAACFTVCSALFLLPSLLLRPLKAPAQALKAE